jgi:signal transduction histidine kinase
MKNGRWVEVAAVVTWLVSGVYPATEITMPLSLWPEGAAIAAYLLYGVALVTFLALPRLTPGACGPLFPQLLLATLSATALLVNYISGVHLGGTGVALGLVVVVAAGLPFVFGPTTVWTWILGQSAVFTMMFLPNEGRPGWIELISVGVASLGFQMFAAASSILLRSEQSSRERLAATNTELHATRALLAENSRAAERLRISRDLHDTLGHHLTALSLQLDVASRLSDGKAAEHVRQAHAITRLLLADVRDVVGSLRGTARVDVAQAIRTFALEQAGITVHLDLPPALVVDDQPRADTLVRCVQEILTNAARHSEARNLWIRLDVKPDGIGIDAHDDGRGATSVDHGHGLQGMRERFEQNAGHVDFQWGPGTGFHVRGFLPLPAA